MSNPLDRIPNRDHGPRREGIISFSTTLAEKDRWQGIADKKGMSLCELMFHVTKEIGNDS